MGIFSNKKGEREVKPIALPAILQPEEPVNYDTVLDWLLRLDDKDYKIMLEVVEVYRNANKTSAKLLAKAHPTSQLHALTDDEIDKGLDAVLELTPKQLKQAIENEPTVGELMTQKALERK